MASPSRSRKLALTLFCSLAFALLFVQPAFGLNDPVLHANRREHAALKRMIKKRSPEDLLGFNPVQNVGNGPPPGSASESASSTAPASSASPSSASSPLASSSAAGSSTVPTATSSGGLLDGLSSLLAGSATSSVASSSSPSSSTTPTSTSTTSTSTTPTPTPTPTPAPASSAAAVSVVAVGGTTITSVVSAPSSSTSADSTTPKGSAALSKSATTVLIVIGACVGGGAIIWTVIRKWKLRASSRFEDRLEPIDWQPSTGGSDLSGSNRPISVASSFHSAGHDGLIRSNSDSSHRGGAGAYGATSLSPLPDHDFTAGAPGGYADMARGPSPQPQMTDLRRGPSLTQQYDYGVPLHHQSGAGYGGQGDFYSTPRY